MKLLITVVTLLALTGTAQAQSLGMRNQMNPPWSDYSPTFPSYQPAPVIGGFEQTYQPSLPQVSPVVPYRVTPSYIPPSNAPVGYIDTNRMRGYLGVR